MLHFVLGSSVRAPISPWPSKSGVTFLYPNDWDRAENIKYAPQKPIERALTELGGPEHGFHFFHRVAPLGSLVVVRTLISSL